MKSCTPLWREAHVEVKSVKNWRVRSTFESWDVEKVHAVVGAKRISNSKCTKHVSLEALLEVEMSKKVHAVLARSTCPSQKLKKLGFGALLGVRIPFRVAGAKDCAPCQKWAKCVGFAAGTTTTTTLHLHLHLHLQQQLHYKTRHDTTWHDTTLHYTNCNCNYNYHYNYNYNSNSNYNYNYNCNYNYNYNNTT